MGLLKFLGKARLLGFPSIPPACPYTFCVKQTQALSDEQQRQIVTSRMALADVRKGEVTLSERVNAFLDEMRASFKEVGRTPLLINLLLSEYLRHEALDAAIQFDGRIVDGPDPNEYVASFPGVHMSRMS